MRDFVLKRTGYRTYEGSHNGHKVRIRAEHMVEHGSFPGNRRQKRSTIWKTSIDGSPAGEAQSFREARALAYDACVTTKRTAGNIETIDTEGHKGFIRVQDVRRGDRVRFKQPFDLHVGREHVSVKRDEEAEVQEVHSDGPTLTVFVTCSSVKGDLHRRSVEGVPLPIVSLIVNSDDPRIA